MITLFPPPLVPLSVFRRVYDPDAAVFKYTIAPVLDAKGETMDKILKVLAAIEKSHIGPVGAMKGQTTSDGKLRFKRFCGALDKSDGPQHGLYCGHYEFDVLQPRPYRLDGFPGLLQPEEV